MTDITIILKYFDTEWHELHLTPEEFYELSPELYDTEPNDIYTDCVDLYDDVREYIDTDKFISKAVLSVSSASHRERRVQSFDYWNSGDNWFCRSRFYDKDVLTWDEVIFRSKVPGSVTNNKNTVYEILRVSLNDDPDSLSRHYHGFIEDNDDGSQSELMLE